jgi:GGDEF domain-containing protein
LAGTDSGDVAPGGGVRFRARLKGWGPCVETSWEGTHPDRRLRVDGYRTELGEVLMSIQQVLAVEECGEAGSLSRQWERAEVPDAQRSVVVRTLRFAGGRLAPLVPDLRLIDMPTGAGSPRALSRAIELDLSAAGGRLDQLQISLFVLSVLPATHIRAVAGDEAADDILRSIVELVPIILRRSDRVYRWGTDEIAVLLPGTGANGAETVRERLEPALARVLADRNLPDVRLVIRQMGQAEIAEAAGEDVLASVRTSGAMAAAG